MKRDFQDVYPKNLLALFYKLSEYCMLTFNTCLTTLGARGFFFRSEAAIVSGEAAIVIHAREKKKTLWTRQLHVSLPCDFETKYLLRDLFVFVIDKSARGATMRETAQIIAR